ncbi:glycosyltransferase family 87 protein [Specibacter cremeus]|uniref:glycosyltransferase family 87 protein n=1 Tax=Specibacter cremeus TaxID=1629051 RepID=UPI000F797091|nr:glycosyltransferase 87 family protein [Specibacter cremeus]
MQEPEHPGHARRHRIAVPTRNDPLLGALTEVAGGPLGRRSAPGLVAPGFFTVERVLVLMTLVSALVAVIFKYHCRKSGWTTPDQYSTVCWSQLPNTFVEANLAHAFPFFTPGVTFDQPPLAGMIAGVTAWLTGWAGTGAARQLAFFDVNAVLIGIAWLVTVVVTARSARRRPWDAAIVAASPVLILTAYVSWDFWAAALVGVGTYLFARRRTWWAGAAIGLAITAAPYALLVLFVLFLLSIRAGQVMAVLETVVTGLVTACLVVAPVLLVNPAAWGAYVTGFLTRPPSDSSLYGGYNLLAGRLGFQRLDPVTTNVLELVLVAVVLLGVAFVARAAPRRPRVAQLAFLAVAGLTVVGKQAAPWQAIWLLPLLALAYPRWRAALLWQAAVVAHFVALMLFQAKVLGNLSDQHAIDMPYFVLAAVVDGAATITLMALVIRGILDPGQDVVRRLGVDDPLGGVLEHAPDAVAWRRHAAAPAVGDGG